MDLVLISGSESLVGKDVAVDLHVRLSQYRQLPQPFAARPWKAGPISSLRDRLMMEWIFCHRDSMKILHNITTLIEPKLAAAPSSSDRRSSTQPKTLTVGVSCSNGYCLSPAFIERLYDHYTCFPLNSTMKISRIHLNALISPKSSDVYQWQHLPCGLRFTRRKNEQETLHRLKILTTSTEWSPVPCPLSIQIEEEYSKNPLNSNIVIDDVQIDFVDGTMYNKSSGQKSFLRCLNQAIHVTVMVRELNDEEYKICRKRYQAAGILPYSVHPMTGEAIFLVGQLTYDGGAWCDFGGLKSRYKLRETAAVTAARECYEETLGVLGSSSHLVDTLRNYMKNNAFKVVNETTSYVGHFVRIPYDHYPAQFAVLTIEQLANDKDLEVRAMRWLPITAVRKAVESTMVGNKVIDTFAINEKDGSYDTTSSIRLRIEFAWSLCIANKLGVLDSIEHITTQIWKSCHVPSEEDQSLLIKPIIDMSLSGTPKGERISLEDKQQCYILDEEETTDSETTPENITATGSENTTIHVPTTTGITADCTVTGSENITSESTATGSDNTTGPTATGSDKITGPSVTGSDRINAESTVTESDNMTGPTVTGSGSSKLKKVGKRVLKMYGMGGGHFMMNSHNNI